MIMQVVTRFAGVLDTFGTVRTNGATLIKLVILPITLRGSCWTHSQPQFQLWKKCE